jgi:hypothetical protein
MTTAKRLNSKAQGRAAHPGLVPQKIRLRRRRYTYPAIFNPKRSADGKGYEYGLPHRRCESRESLGLCKCHVDMRESGRGVGDRLGMVYGLSLRKQCGRRFGRGIAACCVPPIVKPRWGLVSISIVTQEAMKRTFGSEGWGLVSNSIVTQGAPSPSSADPGLWNATPSA